LFFGSNFRGLGKAGVNTYFDPLMVREVSAIFCRKSNNFPFTVQILVRIAPDSALPAKLIRKRGYYNIAGEVAFSEDLLWALFNSPGQVEKPENLLYGTYWSHWGCCLADSSSDSHTSSDNTRKINFNRILAFPYFQFDFGIQATGKVLWHR